MRTQSFHRERLCFRVAALATNLPSVADKTCRSLFDVIPCWHRTCLIGWRPVGVKR